MWSPTVVQTDHNGAYLCWVVRKRCCHRGMVVSTSTGTYLLQKTYQQTILNRIIYPHSMHMEFPSSKRVHWCYVLKLILTIIVQYLFWYVLFKNEVSTYALLLEPFHSGVSIVKNHKHTINITKLQKLVILMILLSFISTYNSTYEW